MADKTASQQLVERLRNARKMGAKSKGVQTREVLRNITIGLNNLQRDPAFDKKGLTPTGFKEIKAKVQDYISDITKVIFGVHVPEVKKYLAEEVIGSLNLAIQYANEQNDSDALQYAIHIAYDRLDRGVQMLADSPDNDELKERLSGLLYHLVPTGNTEERWHEQAIEVSGKLAETERGKSQVFFHELKDGLSTALAGHLGLRRAAAFAYKMLPKAK